MEVSPATISVEKESRASIAVLNPRHTTKR